MTRRVISVTVYVGKCWRITKHYLCLISIKCQKWALHREYDDYALSIIGTFRKAEKRIEKTNSFNSIEYDNELKKVIERVKNKYNDKNILWVSSTSSPVKKSHLK